MEECRVFDDDRAEGCWAGRSGEDSLAEPNTAAAAAVAEVFFFPYVRFGGTLMLGGEGGGCEDGESL
jgi:hypothetical protein